ncbi:MAG: hypothetical protein WED33_12550 [Bacteroidia bacterium]
MEVFTIWLPNSGYMHDNRPHSTRFGPNHHPLNANTEEAFWVPTEDL